jgi:hypothetical protein
VSKIQLLKDLAAQVADKDERIIEVFMHDDAPRDPFAGEEIFLVCYVADPSINRDEQAYDAAGHPWELGMSEAIQPIAREMGITQEIVVTPFNFELHANGEYGKYYATLFLKEGYEPILEKADKLRTSQEDDLVDEPVEEE